MDTYLRPGPDPTDTLAVVSGSQVHKRYWPVKTAARRFTVGFDYKIIEPTTVKAVATHIRSFESTEDSEGAMDGNRVAPNGDDKSWSY